MITLSQMERAVIVVRRELRRLGLWSAGMQEVCIVLAPLSISTHGWYRSGMIFLPALRLFPIRDALSRQRNLRDLLRHEYAHAFADLNRGLFRRTGFGRVFAGSDDYDEDLHVSPYASTSPSEDFAETFAEYVKRRGNRPPWLRSAPLRAKWKFIHAIGRF